MCVSPSRLYFHRGDETTKENERNRSLRLSLRYILSQYNTSAPKQMSSVSRIYNFLSNILYIYFIVPCLHSYVFPSLMYDTTVFLVTIYNFVIHYSNFFLFARRNCMRKIKIASKKDFNRKLHYNDFLFPDLPKHRDGSMRGW